MSSDTLKDGGTGLEPAGGETSPAPPLAQAPKGRWRALGRRILNKWTGLVLAVFLALAWVSGMPEGELRLAAFPDVAKDPEKIRLATTLFQRADAAIAAAEGHYKQLSSTVEAGGYDIPVPPPAAPGETGLKQFVPDLSVGASIERQSTSLSVRVNALAILEKTYSWVGLHNYFVVFREIEPAGCPNNVAGTCWRVVAQYWPSLMRPEVLVGAESDLAQDIAVLVLRGAVRNEGDDWRRNAAAEATPPFLMAAEMPATMAALESTAKGLEILKLGLAHPECLNSSEVECIAAASSLFEFSMERERTLSPAAALGSALIEIDAALRSARKLGSDLEVEGHLNKAEVWTSRALQSEFLRSAMEDATADPAFALLDLQGLAPGEKLIDMTRRFTCALADYRRANWDGCVAKIGQLGDFPPPLQPYVEAALLDASLSEAVGSDDFDMKIDALKQRLLSLNAEAEEDPKHLFMLRRILLKHTCEREDMLDLPGFVALAQDTINDSPHLNASQEATIQAAACRGNQTFPSEDDLARVVSAVDGMADGKERQRFELLLSHYRVRRGDMDGALTLAQKALQLPWAGSYVRKAPEFTPMISSANAGRFINASFTTTAFADLESCQTLE